MHDILNDENFLIYAAKVYDNPQCFTTEEFVEDLNRIKYIKKLLTRYIETGELKERLILNHLMVLSNVFGPTHLPRILWLKMEKQFKYVKPFLVLLNVMPDEIENVRKKGKILTAAVPMDQGVINHLRQI